MRYMKEFRYIKRVGEQCRYVKGVFTPDKRFLKRVCMRAHGNKEATNTNTHSTTENKNTALPYQSSSGQLKTKTTTRHPRYHGQS